MCEIINFIGLVVLVAGVCFPSVALASSGQRGGTVCRSLPRFPSFVLGLLQRFSVTNRGCVCVRSKLGAPGLIAVFSSFVHVSVPVFTSIWRAAAQPSTLLVVVVYASKIAAATEETGQ